MSNIKRQELTKLTEKLMKRKECHFQKHEVERLIIMFCKLTGGCHEKLDRAKFRDILHKCFCMTDDMLMDRVFRSFDTDTDNYLSHEEWVIGLSIMLHGTYEEKCNFCFVAYDLNSDGWISREEMFQLLKNSILKQVSEEDQDENIKELVEIVLKKMDRDHDSRLSLQDFKGTVKEEPLLLEVLGPCLPNKPEHNLGPYS
ncbi:hypothetical protein FSP39_008310 [Pinctada imbricata]|uniref:EF-hand domain-containing protein n=1 Tax=Pinctada imbricata TaxID=66713 RepID=A0AA89C6K4_PINIB|nr:hypothetical protein FSP39_008310 [Pinctada imbricata]